MRSVLSYAFCALAVAVAPTVGTAASISYAIDPASSALELLIGGNPTGVFVDYSGSIAADLSGGVLTFSGGSSIVADAGYAATAPFSGTSSLPAPFDAFGVTYDGTFSGSFDNIALDITGGVASNGTDRSAVTMKPTSGTADASASATGTVNPGGIGITASATFAGDYAGAPPLTLIAGEPITLNDIGSTETLTIPVLTAGYQVPLRVVQSFSADGPLGLILDAVETFFADSLDAAADPLLEIAFRGTLVGSRGIPAAVAVPEPGMLALFGAVLAGLSIGRARGARVRRRVTGGPDRSA